MGILATFFIVAVISRMIYRIAKKKSMPYIPHTPYDDITTGRNGDDWTSEHFQEDTKHHIQYEERTEMDWPPDRD
jgi:hypothetical protein